MRVSAKVEQAMTLAVALAAAWLAVAGGARPAQAQAVADFYRGRTIELDVGTGVGGGYDANARLVARHLGRFIPGSPAIIVNNLPGGGGIRAANTLFNKSSRDGLVLGTFSNAMITEPLLGAGQAMFAPDKFVWIGSASREDGVCIGARSSGVTTWADLLRTELLVGTTAPGTTTYMYPVMLRSMFGVKFKLVSGYPDGGQIALALQRGEVQSVCQTYSSLKVGHPDWLPSGFVDPIIALGLNRIPDLPAVQSVSELAASAEDAAVLKVVLAPTLAGRPFFAPPEIPPERAQALRSAFTAMVGDTLYLADARRLGMDIEPASGGEIETLVKQVYALPAGVIAKTKAVVSDASGR